MFLFYITFFVKKEVIVSRAHLWFC